jgi:PKD repeat protein
MPKVTFTEPVLFKHLKFGGNVIYKQGQSYVIKRNSKAGIVKFYQLKSPNLSFCLSALLWPFATIDQILHWLEYKNNEGIDKSARNAFIKNNLQAIHHDLPGIDPIMDISLPAQYPDYPTCFYAFYDEDNDTIVYEWNNDYEDETYVALGLLKITSRTNRLTPKYKIHQAAFAAYETEFIPGLYFSSGIKLWAAIRACNTRGEVSPWSPYIEIDIPSKPKSKFTGSPVSGPKPLSVDFFDQSTGFIRVRLWDFGDGQQSGETNPTHVFNSNPEYYTVQLTCFGAGQSKNIKTRFQYIHATSEAELYLYVCDYSNNRIGKWKISDLSFIGNFGMIGTGDRQFRGPYANIFDSAVFEQYVCDYMNNRIQVFNYPDCDFLRKIGSYGTGNDQFKSPRAVAIDNDFVYIADTYNHRVHIRYKDTLALYSMFNPPASGNFRFYYPISIAVDSDYIYLTCSNYHRFYCFNKSTLAGVYYIDTSNAVDWTPHYMPYCRVDNNFIYLTNYYLTNSDLIVLLKGGYSPLHKINCGGATYDFYNRGIAPLYPIVFMSDYQNDYLIRIDCNSETITDVFSSYGSGDGQVNNPQGVCLAP